MNPRELQELQAMMQMYQTVNAPQQAEAAQLREMAMRYLGQQQQGQQFNTAQQNEMARFQQGLEQAGSQFDRQFGLDESKATSINDYYSGQTQNEAEKLRLAQQQAEAMDRHRAVATMLEARPEAAPHILAGLENDPVYGPLVQGMNTSYYESQVPLWKERVANSFTPEDRAMVQAAMPPQVKAMLAAEREERYANRPPRIPATPPGYVRIDGQLVPILANTPPIEEPPPPPRRGNGGMSLYTGM